MQLNMFIGNSLIDSIDIDPATLRSREAVDQLIGELCTRHQDLINLLDKPPQFFIENVKSGTFKKDVTG